MNKSDNHLAPTGGSVICCNTAHLSEIHVELEISQKLVRP